MSGFSMAALSGALLGLLIGTVLCLPRGTQTYPNRVLAGGILVSTTYLLSLVPVHSPDLSWPQLLRMGGMSVFLFGPVLYLYVRAITEPGFRLRVVHLVHALPVAMLLLDRVVLAPLLGRNGDGFWLSDPRPLGAVYYLLLVGYLLASARLLQRFHRRITENFSSLEGQQLRWLASLVAIALLLSCMGLGFAIGRLFSEAIAWPRQVWSIGMMVAINYLIAFFAMTRPALFNPPPVHLPEGPPTGASPDPTPDRQPRYETSSLTHEQARAIWDRLEQCMARERPYLRNQLKIGELAQLLDIPASHLSQTINQVGKCSFFNYINRYRVEAARELLRTTEPGARTMLDIALSSGFNSESAFYKQFRSQVGVTPRQFQLQH